MNADEDADILIIGAGAAGLAAAHELSRSKFKVTVLEARDRIGGRIHTHFDPESVAPIELGAEFVHGKPPQIFEIVKHTRLTLKELPNLHWYFRHAVLSKSNEFWSKTEAALSALAKQTGPDQSFSEFLENYCRKHKITDLATMATLYVEGFHAADADRISVQGLKKTNEAAAEIDDEKQFRPVNGYIAIAQALHDEAVQHGASFRFETVVREVNWSAGAVIVNTTGGEQFKARCVIITLPLGVLQSSAVNFVPRLTSKEKAAQALAMGHVVKVILRFRDRFWENVSLPTEDGKNGELKDLAFIHAPDELPPTWWTQLPLRAPLMVGWAGGPRTEQLSEQSEEAMLDQSLEALSHIFAVPRTSLEDSLVEFYTHNWATDPFSLGAYSYIPVGGLNAQVELAKPVEDTIYFAGEAIDTTGHLGTVHGAIASGLRAAREIQCSPGIKA